MHSLAFSNACFRQPGCISLLQCTVALYDDVIAIDVMKLLVCIYQYSCVKVPIQLPTHVVVLRERGGNEWPPMNIHVM